MASRLEITPELLAMVKADASKGYSQEQIAQKLNRKRDTLFLISDTNKEPIIRAYNEGKEEDLSRLLRNVEALESAKSEEVRFKTNKYQLAIKHKVIEQQKVDLDANITGDINVNIVTGGK